LVYIYFDSIIGLMKDLELIRKCSAADPAAWHLFINEYSRLIYIYIRQVLRAKGFVPPDSFCDDVFQDLFIHLRSENFKRLKSYRAKNSCSLSTWLRQVAINFTIDYLRKYKPAALSIDDNINEDITFADMLTDSAPLASQVSMDKEKIRTLKDCIKQLANCDKYFLELYLNRRLGLEKIKDLLHITRAALDMRKMRILQRLRRCFRSKGFMLDF